MKAYPRARAVLAVLLVVLSLPLSIMVPVFRPGATLVDSLFIVALCTFPVVCFVLPWVLSHRFTKHPEAFVVSAICVFGVIQLATYIGWFPLYRQVCGAPIAGFLCFSIAATIFATLAGFMLRAVFLVLGAPAHLCPNCTYDRTGLAVGAACPECGTPAA